MARYADGIVEESFFPEHAPLGSTIRAAQACDVESPFWTAYAGAARPVRGQAGDHYRHRQNLAPAASSPARPGRTP